MRIVFGDEELRELAERLLETKMADDARYMCFHTSGGYVLVAFSRYNGFDGEITVVSRGDNPPMLAAIRHFFHYVWDICECRRATTLCYVDNRQAMRFNKLLGFRREGLMRQAGKEGQDVVVYGMLREEFNDRFKHEPPEERKAA